MCSGKETPESVKRAVVRMARAGLSYRYIAATLGISTRTVGRILKAEKS